MRSAIVLAGYNNRKAVEKYSRIVGEDYGERYIENGYKPLREFSLHHHGKHVTKPLIQFTLEELFKDDQIAEVIIVGNRILLENCLLSYLQKQDKSWKIISQSNPLTEEMCRMFKINKKKTSHDSVGGNVLKGYAASMACTRGEAALFVASDSPMTSMNFINRFLSGGNVFLKEADLVLPAVPVGIHHDSLGRRPFLLINDTAIDVDCHKDRFGRCGFRLSSLILCNLHKIDVNRINDVYSLRKALSPRIQLQIFRICREFGYPGIYRKYFRKKNLSVRECENILSRFMDTRIRAFPILGSETTYDYDGTAKELKLITRMLKRKV